MAKTKTINKKSTVAPKVAKEKRNFTVKTRKSVDGRTYTELSYTDYDAINVLHSMLGYSADYNGNRLTVSLHHLRPYFTKLKAYSGGPHEKALKPTIQYLEEDMKLRLRLFEDNKAHGVITYDDLWLLFFDGVEVAFEEIKVLQGGTVHHTEYNFWGGSFNVVIRTIGSDGEKFFVKERRSYIREYEGVRNISDLPCFPISKQIKDRLSKRGEEMLKFLENASYMSYDGDLIWRSWFGVRRYRANGRCMIDMRTFKLFNSDYRDNDRFRDDDQNTSNQISSVDHWKLSPWLKGFSFVAKQWGEFNFEKMSEISFDEQAFDKLVLPKRNINGQEIDAKNMIKSLVEEGGTSFTDIISGKGGGCIFLLHGPPGTGKTLTAEAVAEILHRPLYSISVGELGTTTDSLEENLRRVLEVATIWNAVVLIDEADIYLEERTVNDIKRNSLVAIFLRLLEYYQGVLFLTTNRVKNFDNAFYSRISIGLHYGALTTADRKKVWDNLLEAAGVRGINTSQLSQHDINGRQIKNSIRIAMALASADDRAIHNDDLQKVIKLTSQFNIDLTDKNVSAEG